MKPRDRVMQALNHQETDRIPIDLRRDDCNFDYQSNLPRTGEVSWLADPGDQSIGLCPAVALS